MGPTNLMYAMAILQEGSSVFCSCEFASQEEEEEEAASPTHPDI